MDLFTGTMKMIEPGSALQITITISLVAAGILLGVLFARSKAETRTFLLACGLLLMAAEVAKQLVLYQIYGRYPWSDFPFQLCSMPMYLCVLYYFLPKRWIAQFVMVYGLIGSVASFFVPAGSFSVYIFLTAHSLFWHVMLLMIGVFLAARQTKEDMRIRYFIPVALTYLVLAAAAVVLDCAFYRISDGTMNMFFLGPGWPDVPILNDIYVNSGWAASTFGMIGVSEAVGFGVYLLIFLLKKIKYPFSILKKCV